MDSGYPAKRRRDAGYASRAVIRPKGSSSYLAITKSIGGSGGLVPDRLRTVLKFTQYFSLTAGPATRSVFRANSLFDPGLTAGSDQPVGYDYLEGLYGYYRVLWCRIKVTPALSTSSTPPQMITVYPSIASNPFSATVGSNASQAYGKDIIAFANSENSRSLVNYMSTRKIFGDRWDNDVTYGAQVSTNPTTSWYWVVDAVSINGGNASASDAVVVTMWFGADFEGRKQLPLSS